MINYQPRDYPLSYICAYDFEGWYGFIAARHVAGAASYAERKRLVTAFKQWCTREFGPPGTDWILDKYTCKFLNKTHAALFKVRWC